VSARPVYRLAAHTKPEHRADGLPQGTWKW
jgi:hypothetical protein